MNENFIVKKYEFDEPHIQKIDSITDNCIRDCHHKYFQRLIIFVNINLILQIPLIMKQLISQFLIKSRVRMN